MIRKSGQPVATSLSTLIELGARHSAVDLAKAHEQPHRPHDPGREQCPQNDR